MNKLKTSSGNKMLSRWTCCVRSCEIWQGQLWPVIASLTLIVACIDVALLPMTSLIDIRQE